MSVTKVTASSSKTTGIVLVLSATFGLALKGIWARLAYAEGLNVSGVLFYRSLLSVPFVAASALWLLRRSAGGTRRFALCWRDYLPGAALGAMFSFGMMCDFEAIEQLGASVSRVVLFGFPLVVLVLDSASRRSLPAARQVFGFVIAWLGLFAVARQSQPLLDEAELAGFNPLAWALASMVTYALYVWLSGKIATKLGSVRLTSVSNLSTAAVVVAVVLFRGAGQPPQVTGAALGWIFVMVMISTVAPYFMLMEGIRRLGATEASLLSMTGPVVTIAAGWLLLGEELTWLQMVGTLGTMLGVGVARS